MKGLKALVSKLKTKFLGKKRDKWAEVQIKEMAKLGGRLVL